MNVNPKESAKTLRLNQDFLDLMRTIYTITGFDKVVPDDANDSLLKKYNGKREVWAQIRKTFKFDPDTLQAIEHFDFNQKDD